MPDDPAAVLNSAAEQLEKITPLLETIVQAAATAREKLADIAAPAANHAGFTGSPDELEVAAATSFGFDRFDAARRRLRAALSDPLDAVRDDLGE